MSPEIIPDAYLDYEDGRLGAVAATLANVELKIGAAGGGNLNQLIILSGTDAKNAAKTIFVSGPLLEAVLQAFNSGSSTVYAMRIGTPGAAATKTLTGNTGADDSILLTAKADDASGNDLEIEVNNDYLLSITAGFSVLDSVASPNTVRLKDETGTTIALSEFDLNVVIDGKCIAEGEQGGPVIDHYVAGLDTGDTNKPKIWFYEDGVENVGKKIDLSGLLVGVEEPRDFAGVISTGTPSEARILLFTQTHYYTFLNTNLSPVVGAGVVRQDLTTLGLTAPAITGGGVKYLPGGTTGVANIVAIDNTTKEFYEFSIGSAAILVALTATYDYSSMIPTLVVGGFFIDGFNDNECYFNLVDGDPEGAYKTNYPTADFTLGDIVTTIEYGGVGDDGDNNNATFSIASFTVGLAILVTDTGQIPATEDIYTGSKGGGTGCQELVDAITADSTALITASLILEVDDALDNVTPAENMIGGIDITAPTNQDYIDAMDLTTGKKEVSWLHPVGAQTNALWAAAATHCDEMLDVHQSERFAIVETPQFVTTAEKDSAEYLSDLQTYVDTITAMMASVANRNVTVFAGGAYMLDSTGVEAAFPITAACGGVMASLEVQKSLINKNVPNVIRLWPEFSQGHLQQLIQARMNSIKLEPGEGFVMVHSLTGAAVGSDYSRVNDLRAVYYGGGQARLAAKPLVGEENDEEGEGLTKLTEFMSRPLEVMVDAGQIDDFELNVKSTPADRLLGDAYAELGIMPLRAFEFIYTTVYLT